MHLNVNSIQIQEIDQTVDRVRRHNFTVMTVQSSDSHDSDTDRTDMTE